MANDGKITKTVIDDKTVWRDARYAALYLNVNKRGIGKLCRDGETFPNARKHPQTGQWSIPDNDVTNARITLETARRAKIMLSFESGTRPRPTTSSCNRIRIKIKNDMTLTPEQTTLFVSRIDAYERLWDTRYAKRKHNGK